MADDVTEYRKLLLRHGIPVEIPPLGESMERLLELACGKTRSRAAKWALSHGRFSDGKRDMLILPPDADAILAVQKAVATAATEDTSLTVPAYEMVMALDMAVQVVEPPQACERSPCGDDPKATEEQIAAARLEVGTPKKRTRRPTGTSGMPFSVSYGLGVDSTAVLVGLAQLYDKGKRPEFRPDFITFGDTGGESDATYAYLDPMNRWLDKVGFPRVTVTAIETGFGGGSYGSSRTLEQQCLINQSMPSISQSKKQMAKCSKLWKQQAQNTWFKLHAADGDGRLFVRAPTQDSRGYTRRTWALRPGMPVLCTKCGWTGTSSAKAPQKCPVCPPLKDPKKEKMRGVAGVVKAIGYDADETGRARAGTFRTVDDPDGKFYTYWYPLQDWGWSRARCIAEIEAAKITPKRRADEPYNPGKSACTFCGMAKKWEINRQPKERLLRAILMEEVAKRSRRLRFPKWLVKGPPKHKDTGEYTWPDWKLEIAWPLIEKYRETGIPQNVLMGLEGDMGNRGLGITFAWSDYALSQGLITQSDLNRVIESAEKIIAEAPRKMGDWDASKGAALSRTAAFRDVPGFRSTGQVFVAEEPDEPDESDEDEDEDDA